MRAFIYRVVCQCSGASWVNSVPQRRLCRFSNAESQRLWRLKSKVSLTAKTAENKTKTQSGCRVFDGCRVTLGNCSFFSIYIFMLRSCFKWMIFTEIPSTLLCMLPRHASILSITMSCSLIQISNWLITWQQLGAFKHVNMATMTC